MAITPIAWNSAAWSSLTGYLVAPTAEALRLAVVERANAVGESVPAVLSSAVAEGYVPRATWAAAIDDTIDALIPQYLDTSGAAPYTAWDEAAILTAIGAGARLNVASAGYLFRAAWAQQVRAILNKLLAYSLTPAIEDKERRISNTEYSWEDAVASFDLSTWGADGAGYPSHRASIGWDAVGGDNVKIIRDKGIIYVDNLPDGASAAIYGSFEEVSEFGYYEDQDYETADPSMLLLVSETETEGRVDITVGSFEDVALTDDMYNDHGYVVNADNSLAVITPAFAYT